MMKKILDENQIDRHTVDYKSIQVQKERLHLNMYEYIMLYNILYFIQELGC